MTIFKDPIDEIASGYRGSQILLTANRLKLFLALERSPGTVEELSLDLGTDPRGTRILCDALVALRLLERSQGRYRNSDLAREYLLPDSPRSKTAILVHTARLIERWGRLYDVVKTGTPVSDELLDPRLLGGEKEFAAAMADVGRESATVTADRLDLSGVSRLLDLGGGPGLYAIECARRNPGLQAVIFDRPETLEVAAENIQSCGLGDRVSVLPGDAFSDDLGGPYDLILVSNLVHIYSAEENRKLVGRCSQALAGGGRLVIKDFLLDPDRNGPAGALLFAVNMLVSTDGGETYTTDQLQAWVERVGLELEQLVDLTHHSRLFIARKPVLD